MDLRRRAALPLLSLALTALLLGLSPFCGFSAGQEVLSSKGQETLSSEEQREEKSSAGEEESGALSSGERGEEERPQTGESGTSENGGEREYRVGILQLIQHPRWGVNLKTDTPSEVIDKIEGTPVVWGTLFSPAAQRALETGRGIDDLKLDYEKAIVKRYRALGITDIQSARKKYYCEKMTAIGRQVGQMMAGGDPNVTYTPDFERKATPIEPPVVPPIRPLDPAAPTVPPQPTLVQGPTPITPEAFDALAFTRKTRARLMDGRTVYVTAVDFELRQVKFYNEKDVPYWVNLDKITAIV
mgnify:CR=1 FL=1